jgi:Glycosyl transferase family 41/Glycosyl transferase family 2
MISEYPLVSIMCVTRNSEAMIERCVQSVLAQTYQNIQFVVQDGLSTDSTLKILDKFRHRLDLVSARDAGMADGFFKAANRCKGEIVGSCWADEELLPTAVTEAVEQFRLHPYAGAVIGAARNVCQMTMSHSDIFPEQFDLAKYLTRTYVPHFVASFFKRSALSEIGLYADTFSREAFEMEIWARLGLAYEIRTFPALVAKYTIHTEQLSHQPMRMLATLKARLAVLDQIFGEGGSLEGMEPFLPWLHAKHISDDLNHLKGFVAKLPEKNRPGLQDVQLELDAMLERTLQVLKVTSPHLFLASGSSPWPIQAYRRLAWATPSWIRQKIPANAKTWIRGKVESLGFQPDRMQMEKKDEIMGAFAFNVAMRLQRRGDVDAALSILRGLEYLGNRDVDSEAMQLAIKSPSLGNQELLDVAMGWAHRHANLPWIRVERHERVPNTKIRVGYSGAFWSAEYMRYQLMPILRAHDRQRFELIGISYSGNPVDAVCPDRKVFDAWVDASAFRGIEYVQHIRSLKLDILVDTTGFSPTHRFAELAHRCAPVQVSYINHNSTSGTPNVDYILADWDAAPEGIDRFFTEKIWRLPVSFFCFNYGGSPAPPIVDPPMTRTGHPTFGYFGSGGKLNLRMIELWAKLLKMLPNSILYVRNGELSIPDNREYLAKRFSRFGIGRDRLRLEKGLPWELLRKEYDQVDISLDTWPYNGGNTISEALWQGVPVISLRGNTMSSRYGSSMLLDLGWEGLVADTEEQYVDCAIRLAKAPDLLRAMRYDLRRASCEGGFRDTKRFAQALETAYCEMFAQMHDMQEVTSSANAKL